MRTTPLEIEGLPPVTRCLWAERARERMRGLLGRDGLAPGEAMVSRQPLLPQVPPRL